MVVKMRVADFLNMIIFAGAAISFVLAFGQVVHFRRLKSQIVFVLFLSVGYWQLCWGLYFTRWMSHIYQIFLTDFIAVALMAPMVYMHFQTLSQERFRPKAKHLLHFIPFLLAIGYSIPWYRKPKSDVFRELMDLYSRGEVCPLTRFTYPIALLAFIMMIYASVILRKIYKIRQSMSSKIGFRRDNTFYYGVWVLLAGIVTPVIVFFSYFLDSLFVFKLSLAFSAFCIALLYLSGQAFPVILLPADYVQPPGGRVRRKTELKIRTENGYSILKTSEIFYLKAQGKRTLIHAEDNSHEVLKLLKTVKAALNPRQFMRIHKSYIVNLAKIRRLEYYMGGSYIVILSDNDETTLPVGRSFVPVLKAELGFNVL